MPRENRATLAGPFLKWAGGKSQLLPQIDPLLPAALKQGRLTRYVEPFVGSGALFFHIRRHYPVSEYLLLDQNPALILTYQVVQQQVEALIDALSALQAAFWAQDGDGRKATYYGLRERFNAGRAIAATAMTAEAQVERAAQLIFLNRTGYNGLYRVNSRGEFNVPFGRYRQPAICQTDTLRAAARCLQGVQLIRGSFADCEPFVDSRAFVYFDPPYRPLSATANFTAYAAEAFDEREQWRLAEFYRRLDQRGACLLLSNSDPRHARPDDHFYAEAYPDFRVETVQARRRINSRADRRRYVSELLILNYASDGSAGGSSL